MGISRSKSELGGKEEIGLEWALSTGTALFRRLLMMAAKNAVNIVLTQWVPCRCLRLRSVRR